MEGCQAPPLIKLWYFFLAFVLCQIVQINTLSVVFFPKSSSLPLNVIISEISLIKKNNNNRMKFLNCERQQHKKNLLSWNITLLLVKVEWYSKCNNTILKSLKGNESLHCYGLTSFFILTYLSIYLSIYLSTIKRINILKV